MSVAIGSFFSGRLLGMRGNAYKKISRLSGKFLLRGAFLIVLTVVSNGCLTMAVSSNAELSQFELFNPSAVYQLRNDESYAFEGMYSNRAAIEGHWPPMFHGYLIIPRKSPAFQYFETNGNLSLSTIEKLPPEMSLRLKTKNKLNVDNEKLADLPKSDTGLKVNETHPYRLAYIELPFAFIIDVVAFPIELPVLLSLSNGPGS